MNSTPETTPDATRTTPLELAREIDADCYDGNLGLVNDAPDDAVSRLIALAAEVIRLTEQLAAAGEKGAALDALVRMTNGFPLEYYFTVVHANGKTRFHAGPSNNDGQYRSGWEADLPAAILAADRAGAGSAGEG